MLSSSPPLDLGDSNTLALLPLPPPTLFLVTVVPTIPAVLAPLGLLLLLPLLPPLSNADLQEGGPVRG